MFRFVLEKLTKQGRATQNKKFQSNFKLGTTTFLVLTMVMSGIFMPHSADAFVPDPDKPIKGGGDDPITIGKWSYIEPGNGYQCQNSPNPFDFDNDGFKEHMCYWYSPQTKILFVDFNGNKQLDNGYELLNSDGYENALEILSMSPDLCLHSECYIWMDKNSNILVDEDELDSFGEVFSLSGVKAYSEGKLSNDVYLPEGRDRGFFIYGEAEDETLGKLYATAPTYWMKGI